MSVRDINLTSVLAAIGEGHDDVDKLAQHFEVLHASHTLRSTMKELSDLGRIARVGDTYTFRVVER